MLCLDRKRREVIVIDTPAGQVRLVVVSISGNRCRLGIIADRSMQISRPDAKHTPVALKRGEQSCS